MAFLRIQDVVRRHGEVEALGGVSLDAAEGELLTVLGPSGSGKSTLLRVIAGLDRPDEGTVHIDGEDVTQVPAHERGVAMVFQSFALFPHLDVARNISFGLDARGVPAAERRERVAGAARRLRLEGLLARRPYELSGGERQRVALARGLIARPRVLLLDEPLSNLDAQLRLETRAELRRVHDELGLTMIHVTHDQAEAQSLGDRLALLAAGRLEQHGPPEQVYRYPATMWVAGFLGSPPMNLLPGTVRDGVVDAAGLRLPLPDGHPLDEGRAVVAGVRPEHVLVGEARVGSAELEFDETVGHERLWHLRAAGVRLVARVDVGDRPGPGTPVGIALAPARLHVFDAESGAALLPPLDTR